MATTPLRPSVISDLRLAKKQPPITILPAQEALASARRDRVPSPVVWRRIFDIAGLPQESASLPLGSGLDILPAQPALAGMRGEGYAILPPESLVNEATERKLLRYVDSHTRFPIVDKRDDERRWPLFQKGGWLGLRGLQGLGRDVRRSIDIFRRRLEKALPGETFQVVQAEVRIRDHDRRRPRVIHVDGGGDVTATLALRGQGTVVYRPKGRWQVSPIEVPGRALAVITNAKRQIDRGIPGTLHSEPFGDMKDRVLLLVRFGPRELPDEGPKRGRSRQNIEAVYRSIDARVRRAVRLLRSAPHRLPVARRGEN